MSTPKPLHLERPNVTLKTRSKKIQISRWHTPGWRTPTSTWALTGDLAPDRAYRSAKEALAKALQLDDSIGEAYDTLGALSWRFDWDWNAADREFNRAIALAPSYSCAHEDRAVFSGHYRPARRSSGRDR